MRPEAAETLAAAAQDAADEAWIDWCRLAVSRGVRFDLDPLSLREVRRIVQVAPGVIILAGEGTQSVRRNTGQPGASGEE